MRSLIGRTSGWGALAIASIDARTVQEACIPGTLSRAYELGQHVGTLGSWREIAESSGGRVMGTGRVRAVRRSRPNAGDRRGNVILEHDSAVIRVEFESEFLTVASDGEMIATCPDIVTLLDVRTGAFVSCESVHQGQDVAVLVLPGPQWWAEDVSRLKVVGPRAFGIDHDAVLMEAQ
ncbi:S-methyl thiohydantoin desulfurase domain-containing protein [Rhodococcus erythropolis]|uniref:S-methyl thiohydantoin desulfurase domain-containing protein n=1 Tax=Rhodococcus erythropolis TaxID=1833 RepID=UPI0033902F49